MGVRCFINFDHHTHVERWLNAFPLSAAKVQCANFGQFLYWPVTRCAWGALIFFIFIFYWVVGGEVHRQVHRQVHKKSRGPRTMNQDAMPKGVSWCATQGHWWGTAPHQRSKQLSPLRGGWMRRRAWPHVPKWPTSVRRKLRLWPASNGLGLIAPGHVRGISQSWLPRCWISLQLLPPELSSGTGLCGQVLGMPSLCACGLRWCAAPWYWPPWRRGTPLLVRGNTKVVSTASCAPWWMGMPFAMTSIRRLSYRVRFGRFRWVSAVFVVTRVACAGNVCVSAFGDARHFRAKTRKRAAKRENAKTAKTRKRGKTRKRENRENAKTRTEVQERESWTAMIISRSSGTSMQNNYIALQ